MVAIGLVVLVAAGVGIGQLVTTHKTSDTRSSRAHTPSAGQQSASSISSSTTTLSPAPTTQQHSVAQDTVHFSGGLNVTLVQVVDHDTTDVTRSCPASAWTPTTQRTLAKDRLVAVVLKLTNAGHSILQSGDPWSGLVLVDGTHATISRSCLGYSTDALSTCGDTSGGNVNLLPGTSVVGCPVVTVPVGASITSVQFSAPFGLSGSAYWRVHDSGLPPLPPPVSKPRVRTCSGSSYTGYVTLRPRLVYPSCATKYTVVVSRITWTTWTVTSAHGTGLVGTWRCGVTDATHAVAHCYPAVVTLSTPITAAGVRVFSHLRAVATNGPLVTVGTGWGP
jgi:hypothetical protein